MNQKKADGSSISDHGNSLIMTLSVASSPFSPQDRAARNAVCFRYFEGKCKFEDCKFLHVSPSKLTHDERAQVLRELPKREYSKKLADVIAGKKWSDFRQCECL